MVARTSAVIVAAVALVHGAAADELKNAAFQIQFGSSGSRTSAVRSYSE
jgi:hypothetical protein